MNTPPPPAQPPRPSRPLFATPQSITFAGIVIALAGFGVGVGGVWAAGTVEGSGRLLLQALFGLVALALGLVALCMVIVGAVRWAVFGKNAVGTRSAEQDRLLALAESINDRSLLSDAAKRIAYRQQDLQVLRQAIAEELRKKDYDAATTLGQELAETYGYREEAEAVRDQVNQAQAAAVDGKVAGAIAKLDELLGQRDFDAADLEAAKIRRLFPESPRVQGLSSRVTQAREQFKLDLEREFLRASQEGQVDRAMQLLKEMDKYLTPAEAEPFRETARGVIGQARDNLGVGFKLAVQDKDWTRAVVVGEQIIGGFPNSKMADEVRSMIDRLRRMAAGQMAATGGEGEGGGGYAAG